jgi:beta-xylosidase
MLFSNTAEFYDGTSRIVASEDGVNWQVIKSSSISQSSAPHKHAHINPKGLFSAPMVQTKPSP